MIVMDDLKDLIKCYPASEEYDTQERLRTIFHRRQEDIRAWHQHLTKGKEPAEAKPQEETIAVKDMGHDLSYYRDAVSDALNNYESGFYSKEKLLKRTNAVLGELTGLRVFFENVASTNTVNVITHTWCDARAEMLLEELATEVIHRIAIKDNVDVRFDVAAGGLIL